MITAGGGRKRLVSKGMRQVLLMSILLVMLFPLVWMLVIAFRERTPDFSSFIGLLGGPFTLSNFSDVLTSGPFARYLLNSTVVAVVVVAGNVLFCSMVGYALARRRIPGGWFLGVTVIAVMMIPPQVTALGTLISALRPWKASSSVTERL